VLRAAGASRNFGASFHPAMRIAVLSDTHDRLPAWLPERLHGTAEIWHLGDVCHPDTLAPLEKLGVPVRIVRGNCDLAGEWPETLTLNRGGVQFHLVHVPPGRCPKGVAAVLHGHTHVPCDETDPLGVRWLNPGSVSRGRGGAPASFAWLEFSAAGGWSWNVEVC
jgi:putative phosphoesterase